MFLLCLYHPRANYYGELFVFTFSRTESFDDRDTPFPSWLSAPGICLASWHQSLAIFMLAKSRTVVLALLLRDPSHLFTHDTVGTLSPRINIEFPFFPSLSFSNICICKFYWAPSLFLFVLALPGGLCLRYIIRKNLGFWAVASQCFEAGV